VVDEFTVEFDAPAGAEWDELAARLASEVVHTLPDDESEMAIDARELWITNHLEQSSSDREHALIEAILAHGEADEIDQATVAAQELMLIAPDSNRGWYWRSRLRLRKGDDAAALEDMREANRRPPSISALRVGNQAALAEQLFNAGELQEALTELKDALAIAPAEWELRDDAKALLARIEDAS
jgi:predicted Zn-dependent protease